MKVTEKLFRNKTSLPGRSKIRFCNTNCRRIFFFFCFFGISGLGILLFADYLWRSEIYGLKYALLTVFSILFTQLSFSFCTVIAGFISRLIPSTKNKEISLSSIDLTSIESLPPTALLFPIYNEDVRRVFAGIKLTLDSLKSTGKEDAFDLFILSDTRNPEVWIQEEAAWLELLNEYGYNDRIHYRHRVKNNFQKSGNVSDFFENWGDHYRYTVIFDADSIIQGDSLVRMVAQMEENPQIALLQSAPAIVKGETLFGRMQQFSNRIYGPLFVHGLNFWQQDQSNYWGHNAIIRTSAFVEHCALPNLPWRAPMGGHILSHDFVESALLAKSGYEVWLAVDVDSSFEETPQTLSESSKRDRRWCQGNLQHGWLVFAKEFLWINKIHFVNGIFGYLGSFLWFWMLIFSTLIVVQFEQSGLTFIPTAGFMGAINLSIEAHGYLILSMTLVLLFSSKILALIDLVCIDKQRLHQHSGFVRITAGVILEAFCSMLLAPLNMIWHSWFVMTIPFGKTIGWNSQQRNSAKMITFKEAIQLHGLQTLIGVGWTFVAFKFGGGFFWWILPVLIPLVFSIPIGMLFTSRYLPQLLSRFGIWSFPEESNSESFTKVLEKNTLSRLRSIDPKFSPVQSCLLDPYLNSLHIILQRRREKVENVSCPNQALLEKAVSRGIDSLDRDQILSLLNHSESVHKIQKMLWKTPKGELHPTWSQHMSKWA